MDFTRDQEIASTSMGRPHVVLVGAGASRAALPNGDANGKSLPLMNDLIELLKLQDLLDKTNISYSARNFEDVYAEIHTIDSLAPIRHELETRIYDYFDNLVLPLKPTIYDYLVLSLRDKDLIATFNWDPFLVQAIRRNRSVCSLPNLLFLNGNVKAACCIDDKVLGFKGNRCSKCKQPLQPTRLLYPVTEKNYESDPMLSAQWKDMRSYMADAFMFTVFGYSAPISDVSAIDLLKKGWGSPNQRVMEDTEIIDIKSEDDLTSVWDSFIHSHHYSVCSDYFESSLARHPRRTGEALHMAQIINAQCAEGNPVPRNICLSDLQSWFKELRDVEIKNTQHAAAPGRPKGRR